MSEKLTKQDIKGPDFFQTNSERLFEWIEQYARLIALVLLVIAVGAIGAVSYGYWKDSQEQKAAEALFKPEAELKDAETKLRDSSAAKMQALAGLKVPAAKPADYEKDFAPSVTKITEQIKAHANTKTALISALGLANFLMQQKQFEAALQVLETAKYRPSSGDLLGGFWHMHRGLAFLENKKADEAIKEYKEVLDQKSLKYLHPEALLKSGVAFELKGDAAKARESYERVGRDFQGSEASNSAQQYLRLLDLKPQQG